MDVELKKVEEFWNHHLCGEHFVTDSPTPEILVKRYEEYRYTKEHHLNVIMDWKSAQDKNVLEIGLGIGADGARLARYAKTFTGIDLTQESAASARYCFSLKGLTGRFVQGDAEHLPFSDHIFNFIYSHGVLHHTPHIEQALTEIHRVLNPNGRLILMLYAKASLNYWLRIQLYFRLRFFVELFRSQLGLTADDNWKSHLDHFRRKGRSYVSWKTWPHHCTDGPDCEIANIYRRSEIRNLLMKAGFRITQMRKAHLPITKGKAPKVERFLAKMLGFYQFVWAEKK